MEPAPESEKPPLTDADAIARLLEMQDDPVRMFAALAQLEPPPGVKLADCPAMQELHAFVRGAETDLTQLKRKKDAIDGKIIPHRRQKTFHFDEIRRIDEEAKQHKKEHAKAVESIDMDLAPLMDKRKKVVQALVQKQKELGGYNANIEMEKTRAQFYPILPLPVLKPDRARLANEKDILSPTGSLLNNHHMPGWAKRQRELAQSAPPICGKRPASSSQADVVYEDEEDDFQPITAAMILQGGKCPAKTPQACEEQPMEPAQEEQPMEPEEEEEQPTQEEEQPMEPEEEEEQPTQEEQQPMEPEEEEEPPTQEEEQPMDQLDDGDAEVMSSDKLSIAELLPPEDDDDDDGIPYDSDFTHSSSGSSDDDEEEEEEPQPKKRIQLDLDPRKRASTAKGKIWSDSVNNDYESPDEKESPYLPYEDGLIGDDCKWCGQKVDEDKNCLCQCWKEDHRSECMANRHANGFFPNRQLAHIYRVKEEYGDQDSDEAKKASDAYRKLIRDIVVNGDPIYRYADDDLVDPRSEGHVSNTLVSLFTVHKASHGKPSSEWCLFCRKQLVGEAKKNAGFGMCNSCRVSVAFIKSKVWIPAKEKAGLPVRANEYRSWILKRLKDGDHADDLPRAYFVKACFWDKRGLHKVKRDLKKIDRRNKQFIWSWTGLPQEELVKLGIDSVLAISAVQIRGKRESAHGPDNPCEEQSLDGGTKRKRSVVRRRKKKKAPKKRKSKRSRKK